MSKTHIKMGMHNRITIDRFQAIKDDVIAGLPVNKVAKRNNVSESTVRKVRRSKNFHEYRIRADEQIRDRNKVVVVAPTAGVPFEDFGQKPLFFSPKKLKSIKPTLNRQLNLEAEHSTRCLGLVLLGIIGLILVGLVAITIVGASK
jgi:hypothetical protein